jgi:plasmid stabilization system protein ParE
VRFPESWSSTSLAKKRCSRTAQDHYALDRAFALIEGHPPDRVREEIYAAIRSLVNFPHQGHSRSDLTSRPLRFQSLRDYVIAYAPDEKPLAVIAVLHGRRNPRIIAALLHGRT